MTTTRKEPTIKELAKANGVSERCLYQCRALVREGRHDLLTAVALGEITLNAAMKAAGLQSSRSQLNSLLAEWEKSDSPTRAMFLATIEART